MASKLIELDRRTADAASRILAEHILTHDRERRARTARSGCFSRLSSSNTSIATWRTRRPWLWGDGMHCYRRDWLQQRSRPTQRVSSSSGSATSRFERAASSTLTEAADRFDDKVRVTALDGAGSNLRSGRIGSLPGWTNLVISLRGPHRVPHQQRDDAALVRFRRDRAESLGVVVEPPSRPQHLPEADERYRRRSARGSSWSCAVVCCASALEEKRVPSSGGCT